MKKLVGFIMALVYTTTWGQVDTAFVYNTSTPYGTLDIRLAEAANRYYYLQENITVSFRENPPGVKTNTFHDMTSWDSSPYTQGNMRKLSGSNDAFVMNYRLLFPSNYNASYTAGYPIIIMLHGMGERANCWDTNCYWSNRDWRPTTNTPAAPKTWNHALLNNDHNLSHGGMPHLEARNLAGNKLPDDPTLDPRAFPGFVLFPQNLNGWESTSSNDVIRLIRLVIKKYKIDPNRVYLHGLSNGGQGCYDVVKRAPWLFAAVLPMSAINETAIISRNQTPTIAHIPFWTFQGGQDTDPLPSTTARYVKTFREAGMDIRYSNYPNLGHGTWNTAYAEPDFFSWMLSKRKSNVHVFYNTPEICGTTGQGAKLGFAAGFRAYQWEKDGVIIPGATGHEYIATQPGVYRGRFSRVPNPGAADWNAWSQPVPVTIKNPGKAVVDVIGTHMMRGPDNDPFYNTVHLKANTIDDKYYWYKNGALINIPNTNLDDTTRTYSITALYSNGNGKFTLISRGINNCPTLPSDTVFVYFNNSTPTMPSPNNIPTNFTGVALSQSSIELSWSSNCTFETGFEIWRRKPGDIFRVAGMAPPNATSFIDNNVEPSTTYDYKIRTLAEKSKSNWAPNNNININLVVSTGTDTIPPGPASNVVVTGNTVNSISLSWTAATDNVKIKRYLISYGANSVATPDASTSFTLTGLPMNVAYNIGVTAEDFSGNFSAPTAPVVGTTYVTGLTYGHSTGAWTDLDLVTVWNTPEFTGVVPNFTLNPRTQEDFFVFEFTGYLYIQNGGNYEFSLASDDGSRLTIDNNLVIDHDGLHGVTTRYSAPVFLSTGPHLINVKYLEYTGGQSLTIRYKGSDTNSSWINIPNSALKSGSAPPTVSGSSLGEHVVVSERQKPEDFVSVSVFPNPTSSDRITVAVAAESNESVQINMLDVMGKSYFEGHFTSEEARQGAKINTRSTLMNGLYVIVVTQGKYTVKQKVIIRN